MLQLWSSAESPQSSAHHKEKNAIHCFVLPSPGLFDIIIDFCRHLQFIKKKTYVQTPSFFLNPHQIHQKKLQKIFRFKGFHPMFPPFFPSLFLSDFELHRFNDPHPKSLSHSNSNPSIFLVSEYVSCDSYHLPLRCFLLFC